MNKKILLGLSTSAILLLPRANAAGLAIDARSQGMGNTGVASANYLLAPFYNPALVANFTSNDDFAFLLPAVAVAVNDKDDSLSTIDDLQASIESYESSNLDTQLEVINAYLDQLDDNDLLAASAGMSLAVALPNKTVASNLFARGYAEIVADTEIEENDYINSEINMVAFTYTEIGLALAKEVVLLNEKISFGISPKYQQMQTYAQGVSVADFDIDEYDENKNTENALNLDLGVIWYKDNFRAGLAVKDLFAQEIATRSSVITDSYQLNTQVTVAIAYTGDVFMATMDADLTEQSRFKNLNDNTQFIRFGLEADAWRWAQLRAGYEIDLQNTMDNAITAGIGISPLAVMSVNLGGSYAGEQQFALSADLAFTF